jgi:phosphotransferase system IIB component
MLTTALVDDTEIAAYDEQLMTNLLVQKKALAVVAKEKMLIGLRNSDGEIYRIIGTSVAQSYNNAIEELIDMEMTNELEDETTPQNGFLAIFSE